MKQHILAIAILFFKFQAPAAAGDASLKFHRFIDDNGMARLSAVHIAPTTPSLDQGLKIQQIGPSNGQSAGPLFFNSIFSIFSSKLVGSGEPGRRGCACVAGLQTTLTVGGTNLDATELYGGSFGISHTLADDNSAADKVGLSAGAYSNKISPGKIYGASAGSTVDKGGSTPQLVGFEVDSIVNEGANVPRRIGLNVWNGGKNTGYALDTAYAVSNSGTAIAKTGAWKKLISLYTNNGKLNAALATDADFFFSDSSATVANIFNLSNVKVTGNILKFPSTVLTGSGNLTVSTIKAYSHPPEVKAGEIAYGGATAPASKCGSLPGAAGCVEINVAGKRRYIPYW